MVKPGGKAGRADRGAEKGPATAGRRRAKDGDPAFDRELAALAPAGERRMSANPHANGGRLLRDLVMPDFRVYGVPVVRPATELSSATA